MCKLALGSSEAAKLTQRTLNSTLSHGDSGDIGVKKKICQNYKALNQYKASLYLILHFEVAKLTKRT